MNERIEKLAEQAHSYACEYARRPDYNPHNPYNEGMYKQRYDSKFAELIVEECCQVMESLPSTTYHVGRSRMSEEIKLHFGVEE